MAAQKPGPPCGAEQMRAPAPAVRRNRRETLRHGQKFRSARGDHTPEPTPEAPGKKRGPPLRHRRQGPFSAPVSAGGRRAKGNASRCMDTAFRPAVPVRKEDVPAPPPRAKKRPSDTGERPPFQEKKGRLSGARKASGKERCFSRGPAPAPPLPTPSGRFRPLRLFPVFFYRFRPFLPGREGASFPGADD